MTHRAPKRQRTISSENHIACGPVERPALRKPNYCCNIAITLTDLEATKGVCPTFDNCRPAAAEQSSRAQKGPQALKRGHIFNDLEWNSCPSRRLRNQSFSANCEAVVENGQVIAAVNRSTPSRQNQACCGPRCSTPSRQNRACWGPRCRATQDQVQDSPTCTSQSRAQSPFGKLRKTCYAA